MINLSWTIHDGNLDARPNTELPHYLDVNYYPEGYVIPENQTGIPYCRGRYNTGETFETDVKTAHNGKCYMAGNIAPGNIQPQTVGLDCMRFLCASFDFEDGLAPWQFKEDYLDIGYGHEVDSVSELHEMDVIISSKHAMFYKELENGTIVVYDTTSGVFDAKTNIRNTNYTEAQLRSQGYRFYHVYSKIKHNATQHWEQCESCGGYQQNYENHTMSYEYNIQNHWGNCTGCDYQLGTTSHTISSGYLYNATYHWRGCTANCGHKSHNARHNTSNFGACSVCGYNPNVINTTPGTEVILQQ